MWSFLIKSECLKKSKTLNIPRLFGSHSKGIHSCSSDFIHIFVILQAVSLSVFPPTHTTAEEIREDIWQKSEMSEGGCTKSPIQQCLLERVRQHEKPLQDRHSTRMIWFSRYAALTCTPQNRTQSLAVRQPTPQEDLIIRRLIWETLYAYSTSRQGMLEVNMTHVETWSHAME